MAKLQSMGAYPQNMQQNIQLNASQNIHQNGQINEKGKEEK